ncbi:retinal-specific ATP-binding cassette transporter [Galendromus occidentalis]|uniref:Retinal-specific ATP-binding cassette transporter n=1 Tax=Galendromus occidentalis TaxID=34638 RepID=A0AAJ6QQM0_9ACAR|nr:retinal-specific ATP-binding cassette transporter [Galendromus occidentalis]
MNAPRVHAINPELAMENLQPSFFKQLRALLWKDIWVTRLKRSLIASILEVAIPFGLIGLLVFLRSLSEGGARNRPSFTWRPQETFNSSLLRAFPTRYRASKDPRRIVYAPQNGLTADIMVEAFGDVTAVEGVDDAKSLNEYIMKGQVLFSVEFTRTEPKNLAYEVRINQTLAYYETSRLFPHLPQRGPRAPDKNILPAIMESIMTVYAEKHNVSKPAVYLSRFPFPSWLDDKSFTSLSSFIPVLYVYGYTMFVIRYIRRIVQEKQSRIKEHLRMMGLSDWVYWTNTFLNGFLTMALVSIMAVLAFKIPVRMDQAVLTRSDPTLILSVFLLHAVGATLYLMFLTVLFQSPVIGTLVGTLCWFLSLSISTSFLDPINQNRYQSLSRSAKLLTTLFLPNSGLYWCFKLISFRESQGVGAHWASIYSPAVPGDNIVLGSVMTDLLLGCLLYSLLIFYLDNVWPWQLGIPRHPLFLFQAFLLFQRSYWVARKNSCTGLSDIQDQTSANELFEEYSSSSGQPAVVLRSVSKYFGSKQVLKDVSLRMYNDEISVLLGHNGAGKTTTMNILTGLFPPSSGQLFINGFNVRTHTRQARKNVGLCPQHNVLFDELTVREHLVFFGKLKGAPEHLVNEEAEELVCKFELTPKMDTLSKNLSGGMKRKLSMANAMVGGSSVIILDEPTAGMDPQARRMVWTVLQELRKGRTILLTTHYMEEADVLGDRITFLTAGAIMCSGSPMFLKKKFETGYKMRIAKASPDVDVDAAMEVVQRFVGGTASVEADMTYEYVVNLGFPTVDRMVDLFKFFEENKADLGVVSLGVAVTTMEDVFLKVGELGASVDGNAIVGSDQSPEGKGDGPQSNGHAKTPAADRQFPTYERVSGARLHANHFVGLLMKRHDAAKRQWWLPVFMVVLPILTTILFCIVDSRLVTAVGGSGASAVTYDLYKLFGPTESFLVPRSSSALMNATWNKLQEQTSVQIFAENTTDDDIQAYLLQLAHRDLNDYKLKHLVGATYINESALNIWYSGEPYHVQMCALTSAYSAILGGQVRVTYQPIPWGSESFPKEKLMSTDTVPRLFCAALMSLSLAFITSSFIIFPVQENVSKAKLMQLMTGVNRLIYFLSSILYDIQLHIACCLLVLSTLLLGNPDGVYTHYTDTPWAILILLVLFGFATIPLAYLVSHWPKKPSTGFSMMVFLGILVGMIGVLVVTMLQFLGRIPGNPLGIDNEALRISTGFLHFLPHFAVIWGFSNIHYNGALNKTCESIHRDVLTTDLICGAQRMSAEATPFIGRCCSEFTENNVSAFRYDRPSAFSMDDAGAGWEMICLVITGSVLFALNLIIEMNLQRYFYKVRDAFCRKRKKDKIGDSAESIPAASFPLVSEDEDVLREKELVEEMVTGSLPNDGLAMTAYRLSKFYGNFHAVKDVSFRVKEKECFGLLGVNGAGKTTTFRMLCGDLLMSAGDAFISDCSLRENRDKFQTEIGYCPQFDAIIDTMSAREMFRLFGILRGVPLSRVNEVTEFLIQVTDLSQHADKMCGSYSGGNKRKLSIGLAILGGPKVIFLDEPTAGVDPEARRKIWNALTKVQRELGSAIVLTSHSMEECEALCDRLCIMVNGGFRCIGSTQRLKSKYGEGFTVFLKLRADRSPEEKTENSAKVCDAMDELFPNENHLISSHQALLHFHITDPSISWSALFAAIAELNSRFAFEDSIVSDTTLEQIFLNFAKTQFILDE